MDKRRLANILIPTICTATVIIPPTAVALAQMDWSHHSGETGDISVVGERTQKTIGLNSAIYSFAFEGDVKPSKIDSIQAINTTTGEIIQEDLLVVGKETYDSKTGQISVPIRLNQAPLEKTNVEFGLLFTYTIDSITNSSVVNELKLDADPIETKTVSVSMVNKDATISKTSTETIKPFEGIIKCENRDIIGIKEIRVGGSVVDDKLYKFTIRANCREGTLLVEQGVISDDVTIEINYAFMNVSTNVDDLHYFTYAQLCYYNHEFHHTFHYVNGMTTSKIGKVVVNVGGKPLDEGLWSVDYYKDRLEIFVQDGSLIKDDIRVDFLDLKKAIIPTCNEFCSIVKDEGCYENIECTLYVKNKLSNGEYQVITKNSSGEEVTLNRGKDYDFTRDWMTSSNKIDIHKGLVHDILIINYVVDPANCVNVSIDAEHKDWFTFLDKKEKNSSGWVYLYWNHEGEPQDLFPEVYVGGEVFIPSDCNWDSEYDSATHKRKPYLSIYFSSDHTNGDIYFSFNEPQHLVHVTTDEETGGRLSNDHAVKGQSFETRLSGSDRYPQLQYDINSKDVKITSGETTLDRGTDYNLEYEESYSKTYVLISITNGEKITGDIQIHIPEWSKSKIRFTEGSEFLEKYADLTMLPSDERYNGSSYYGEYYLRDIEHENQYDFYLVQPYKIDESGNHIPMPENGWRYYCSESTTWSSEGTFKYKFIDVELHPIQGWESCDIYIDILRKPNGHDIHIDSNGVNFMEYWYSDPKVLPRAYDDDEYYGEFFFEPGFTSSPTITIGDKVLQEGRDFRYEIDQEWDHYMYITIFKSVDITDDIHFDFNLNTYNMNYDLGEYQDFFYIQKNYVNARTTLDNIVLSFDNSDQESLITINDVVGVDVFVGEKQLKVYEYSYSWTGSGDYRGDLNLYIDSYRIDNDITVKLRFAKFRTLVLGEDVKGAKILSPKAYYNDDTIPYYETQLYSYVPLTGSIEIVADGKTLVQDKDYTFERYTLDYSYISIAQHIIESSKNIVITKLGIANTVNVYGHGPEDNPDFFGPPSEVATKGESYNAVWTQTSRWSIWMGDILKSVQIYIGDYEAGTGRYLKDSEFAAYMVQEERGLGQTDLQIIIYNGSLVNGDIHIFYELDR